jgi:predicted nucleic acid-binding protein
MERTTKHPIIADTSGLVSLATDTDQNHLPALQAAADLRTAARPIILPTDVYVETINVLGKKSGHETALKVASQLLHPDSQFLLMETHTYLIAAIEKFKKQPPAVSLTDCIVMAVADDYGTKDIFGFDRQFADAGYTRLEPSPEWKETE